MKKQFYYFLKISSIALILFSVFSCSDSGNNFVGHWIDVKETHPYRAELNITKSGDIFIIEQNSWGGSSSKFSAKLENGSLKMAQQLMGAINYSKQTDHIFFQEYELMRSNGETVDMSTEERAKAAQKFNATQDSLKAVMAMQEAAAKDNAQAIADAQAKEYAAQQEANRNAQIADAKAKAILDEASIQRIDCNDNQVSSVSGKKTTVNFDNRRADTYSVKLYGIDNTGKEKFFTYIATFNPIQANTYAGYIWVIKDNNDNCIVRFKVLEIDNATAIIR